MDIKTIFVLLGILGAVVLLILMKVAESHASKPDSKQDKKQVENNTFKDRCISFIVSVCLILLLIAFIIINFEDCSGITDGYWEPHHT
jgi:quinol-cytochrome oxidoreductase complex cytochrome b subunit